MDARVHDSSTFWTPWSVATQFDHHSARGWMRKRVCADLVAPCCKRVYHGLPHRLRFRDDGRRSPSQGIGAASSLMRRLFGADETSAIDAPWRTDGGGSRPTSSDSETAIPPGSRIEAVLRRLRRS